MRTTRPGTSASSTLAIVSQYASTVTASESPNPAGYAAAVTFTAVVSEVNGTVPTGTITFTVDGTVIGTGTLDATGKATFVYNRIAVGGRHALGGGPPIPEMCPTCPGPRPNSTLTITGLTSNVTLTYVAPIPANPPGQPDAQSVYGQNVTLTAQLTVLNGVVPDGTFSFYVNGNLLGTAPSDATGKGVLVTPEHSGRHRRDPERDLRGRYDLCRHHGRGGCVAEVGRGGPADDDHRDALVESERVRPAADVHGAGQRRGALHGQRHAGPHRHGALAAG